MLPRSFKSSRLPRSHHLTGLTLLTAFAALAVPAHADPVHWTTPTAAEFAMKSEPKAPGAPAIILSYDEDDDSTSGEVIVHVRIKVLTEGGIAVGTVRFPAARVNGEIVEEPFFARTIHPDGSIELFKGTPQSSTVVDQSRNPFRVAAMPSVTVGSIVEYGYLYQNSSSNYRYLNALHLPPWQVQQSYFTRSAHFLLRLPFDRQDSILWVAQLPPDAAITRDQHRIDLKLNDIPPLTNEEFMPPGNAAFYNVRFFYQHGTQDYWGFTGAGVDERWSDFDRPSRLIKDAVNHLVEPGDDAETRLRKIYQAVEKLDNTDLDRRHSTREDKADGLKTSPNADTIWTNKRGSSDQLTLLFVALARGAGYTAYPMAVASRNWAVFDPKVLSWNQVDAIVAIVDLGGNDLFFDPGTRYCAFNHVAPWHSNVTGVSTEAKLIKIRMTPLESYQFNRTDRAADLSIAANGSVTGSASVAWTGNAALPWRREALRTDTEEIRKAVEKLIQDAVPEGVEIRIASLKGLTDGEAQLVATFDVTGRLGTPTSKRLILPAHLFASRNPRLLAPENRIQPIMFPESFVIRDHVVLHLPAELSIETLPDEHTYSIARDTAYRTTLQSEATRDDPTRLLVVEASTLVLNRIDYKVDEYAELRRYFGEVASSNSEQIVLTSKAPSAASSAAGPQPNSRAVAAR